MGILTVTCPVTGDDFSTGIYIDHQSFEMLRDAVMKAQCPHCEQIHPWKTRQAKWMEYLRPSM